jgi:hypothetical protein
VAVPGRGGWPRGRAQHLAPPAKPPHQPGKRQAAPSRTPPA